MGFLYIDAFYAGESEEEVSEKIFDILRKFYKDKVQWQYGGDLYFRVSSRETQKEVKKALEKGGFEIEEPKEVRDHFVLYPKLPGGTWWKS